MDIIENPTLEDLFKKFFNTGIVETLAEDVPLSHLIPYLFYALFKKYGKEEIVQYVHDSCGNLALVFEMDEQKTSGIRYWIQSRDNGSDLHFYCCNRRPDSNIAPAMSMSVWPAKMRNGRPEKAPWVTVSGLEFDGWLGRKGDFDESLFLANLLKEDLIPAEKWVAKTIKRFGVTVYGYH